MYEGERVLALGGTRQRSVLALLVLHRGRTLSSDRLIDELWGDAPPADAQTALQQHVSRLRKALEPHAVLVTRAPGYALEVEPEQIDLERFRLLHERGRGELEAGASDDAARTLRSALELWRGPPLSDLANEPFVAAATRELDDERLSALESRIDADLACGRHTELVGELTGLVRAHPLRERMRGQLMLALYRSGRQADALDAYSDARQTLVVELGLEPGPELQSLQQSILTHDESLRAPRPPATRRRRRWLALAATAAVSALLAAIVAAVALRGDEPAASTFAGGGILVALDAESGSIERRLPAGRTPSAVAVGGGAIWVVDADARTVLRVIPSSRVVETLATGATPTDVAYGAGSVWVANGRPIPKAQFIGPVATAVARLDPATRTERESVRLRRRGNAVSNLVDNHVAVSPGAVWAVAPDFSVVRFDVVGGNTTTTRDLPAAAVATGPAGVWVLGVNGSVARLDPRSGRVVRRASVPTGYVGSIAVGDDSAWVTGPGDGKLWRIRAGRAESVGAIDLSPGVGEVVAVAGSGVWVANSIEGTVTEIDPETSSVVQTIDVGGIPRSIAVDGETLWIAVSQDPVAEPSSGVGVGGIATFPSSVCERVQAGAGGVADYLITSDLPLQGGQRVSAVQMRKAITFTLREHGFRAGPYRLAYQSCDDSVARTGLFDEAKCASNARAYGQNADVIGVLGTLNSGCAVSAIPELNRAPNGPLAMVSPLNDFIGLTRPGPGVDPSLPAALYPTGVRNYLRVYPTGDLEGAALALFARDHGWRRVFVLDDHDPGYGVLSAEAFLTAAGRVGGLTVVGSASWDPRAKDYATLMRVVRASNPDVVYVGGLLDTNAGGVIRELRTALGRDVHLVGPSGLTGVPQLMKSSRGSALGMYLSFPGVLLEALPPAGSSWVERFRKTQRRAPIEPSAVYAAQATEVLLDAIARSDGTRASVVEELFATRVADGLLGTFGFDENGDISESPITIVRVQRGGRGNLVQSLDGAPVVKVERPSPALVAVDE